MSESSETHRIILFAKGAKYRDHIRMVLSSWLKEDCKAILMYDCIEIIRRVIDDYTTEVLDTCNGRYYYPHEFVTETAKVLMMYMQSGMFDYLLKRRGKK